MFLIEREVTRRRIWMDRCLLGHGGWRYYYYYHFLKEVIDCCQVC
jgi:hypothetical protein